MKSHGLVPYGWISDNKMQCHLFFKKKKRKEKKKDAMSSIKGINIFKTKQNK